MSTTAMSFSERRLSKFDPSFKEILFSSQHVTVYELKTEDERKRWVKLGIEGPLFIISRNTTPFHRLLVLNRNDNTHFESYLAQTGKYKFKYEDSNSEHRFVLFSSKEGRNLAFWFNEADDNVGLIKTFDNISSGKEDEVIPTKNHVVLEEEDENEDDLVNDVNSEEIDSVNGDNESESEEESVSDSEEQNSQEESSHEQKMHQNNDANMHFHNMLRNINGQYDPFNMGVISHPNGMSVQRDAQQIQPQNHLRQPQPNFPFQQAQPTHPLQPQPTHPLLLHQPQTGGNMKFPPTQPQPTHPLLQSHPQYRNQQLMMQYGIRSNFMNSPQPHPTTSPSPYLQQRVPNFGNSQQDHHNVNPNMPTNPFFSPVPPTGYPVVPRTPILNNSTNLLSMMKENQKVEEPKTPSNNKQQPILTASTKTPSKTKTPAVHKAPDTATKIDFGESKTPKKTEQRTLHKSAQKRTEFVPKKTATPNKPFKSTTTKQNTSSGRPIRRRRLEDVFISDDDDDEDYDDIVEDKYYRMESGRSRREKESNVFHYHHHHHHYHHINYSNDKDSDDQETIIKNAITRVLKDESFMTRLSEEILRDTRIYRS